MKQEHENQIHITMLKRLLSTVVLVSIFLENFLQALRMNIKLLISNDTRIRNKFTSGYIRFHFSKNGFLETERWFLNIMNKNQFNVDKRNKSS